MARTDNLAPVELEIVTAHGIQDDDGWKHYSYEVRLHRGDESMLSPWKQGLGITGNPSAEDVLSSLIMDAQGAENAGGFEEWAEEYGLDTDSRKAEKTYNEICKIATALYQLLGEEDYQSAMQGDAEEEAKRLVES